MNDELYQKIYNYIKNSLYSENGLMIKLFDNVPNKEQIENKNLQVLTFLKSDVENERIIIDRIINMGIQLCNDWQYIVNEENIKKFLTPSALIKIANNTYDGYLIELQEQEDLNR